MEAKEIFEILQEKFGDRILETDLEGKEPSLKIHPVAIGEVCLFARDDPRLRFDYLACLSGVDHKTSLGVAYHLDSIEHGHRIALKVELDREDPKVPTVSAIWPTANWHEREAYDLVGIHFEGHPNLVRILCAEDWVGHPLRKDYEFPKEYHGIPGDIEYMDFFGEQKRWQ